MTLSPGDTLCPAPGFLRANYHLWVVLTEPHGEPPEVVMTNLTSFRGDGDPTVILDPDDHPFVRHKTSINYSDSRISKVDEICMGLKKEIVLRHQSFRTNVLKRIKQGLLESQETPQNIKNYCHNLWLQN